MPRSRIHAFKLRGPTNHEPPRPNEKIQKPATINPHPFTACRCFPTHRVRLSWKMGSPARLQLHAAVHLHDGGAR